MKNIPIGDLQIGDFVQSRNGWQEVESLNFGERDVWVFTTDGNYDVKNLTDAINIKINNQNKVMTKEEIENLAISEYPYSDFMSDAAIISNRLVINGFIKGYSKKLNKITQLEAENERLKGELSKLKGCPFDEQLPPLTDSEANLIANNEAGKNDK